MLFNHLTLSMVENSGPDTTEPKAILPIMNYEGLFGSEELSKMISIIYPEISEVKVKQLKALEEIIISLLTGDQRRLLRGIEFFTSWEVSRYIAAIVDEVKEENINITSLKDLDPILTKGKDAIWDQIIRQEQECANFQKILDESMNS